MSHIPKKIILVVGLIALSVLISWYSIQTWQNIEGGILILTRDAFIGILNILLFVVQIINLYLDNHKKRQEQNQLTEQILFSKPTVQDPPSYFIGREDELAFLLKRIELKASVIYITGGPGTGKTVLARKLAKSICKQYPDGELEIDLNGTAVDPFKSLEAEKILKPIISAYFQFTEPLVEKYKLKNYYHDILKKKRMLILFDNAKDIDQVNDVFPPFQSRCLIIITSRAKLNNDENENTLHLGPLLDQDAKKLLFSSSPRMRDCSEEISNDIVRLCENNPLVIRAASSLFEVRTDWGIDYFCSRLSNEETKYKDLSHLNNTNLNISNSFGSLFSVLDNEHRDKFCRLGILPFPFTIDELKFLWECRLEEVERWVTDFILINIIKPYETGFQTKYTLASFVRVLSRIQSLEFFPKEKLIDLLVANANYYLKKSIELEKIYCENSQVSKKEVLNLFQEMLLPQLLVAWARMCGQEPELPLLPEHIADGWIYQIPFRIHHLLDKSTTSEQEFIVKQPSPLAQNPNYVEVLEAALCSSRKLEIDDYTKWYLGKIGKVLITSNPNRSKSFFEEELSLSRNMGDKNGEATALNNLGVAYKELGYYNEALNLFTQSRDLFTSIGDEKGLEDVHGNIARTYDFSGSYDESLIYYRLQLELIRKYYGESEEATVLRNIALVYYRLLELELTRKYCGESEETTILNNLPLLNDLSVNVETAINYMKYVKQIDAKIGHRDLVEDNKILEDMEKGLETLKEKIKEIMDENSQ